jgi:hypothetical protein
MIDYETYHKFHEYADAFKFSNCRIVPFENWPKKISVTTTLSPEETMLLPPGIHGFFLKDKKWGAHGLNPWYRMISSYIKC